MLEYNTERPSQNDDGDGGGLNLESVAEEVLNGMFCHYEPPTSSSAQVRAAHEAMRDPERYSSRSKPILRPSRLHRMKKTKTDKGGATTSAGGFTKSVTWRDEQNHRTNVERNIVGCAANYCGIFMRGEGLADVHVSPSTKEPSSAATKPLQSIMKSNLKGTASTTTKSVDESSTDGSITKKGVTPTSQAESSIATGSADVRVLYDDEGNPIQGEQADDDDTETDEGTGLPDGPDTPVARSDDGTEPATPSTLPGTNNNSNNPMSFFGSLATSVMNTAAAAGAAAGISIGQPTIDAVPTTTCGSFATSVMNKAVAAGAAAGISIGQPTTAAVASPATPVGPPVPTVQLTPPSGVTSGVAAEYLDDIGVYEPENYDRPYPSKDTVPYRRIRSPPAPRRHPTPRHVRPLPDDGTQVAPAQGGTTNVSSSSMYYDEQREVGPGRKETSLGNSSRPLRTSSRRSDVYSDLTEDAIFYRSPRPGSEDYASPSRSGISGRNEDALADRDYYYYHHPDDDDQPLYDEEDELTPAEYARRYAERHGKRNSKGWEGTDNDDSNDAKLNPPEYAEKYGQSRMVKDSNGIMGDNATTPIDNIRRDDEVDMETKDTRTSSSTKSSKSQKREQKTESKSDTKSLLSKSGSMKSSRSDRSSGAKSSSSSRKSSGRASMDKKMDDELDRRSRWTLSQEEPTDEVGAAKSSSSSRKSSGRTSMDKIKDELDRRSRRTLSQKEPTDEVGARDPTPRKNILDPTDQIDIIVPNKPLPPTPRRDSDRQDRNSYSTWDDENIPRNFDRLRMLYQSRHDKTVRERTTNAMDGAFTSQLSPRSMATDDEIREEASSVGMASETIRPMYNYPNPFADDSRGGAMQLTRESNVKHTKHVEDANRGQNQSTPYDQPVSTMSGSSQSTLSSKQSAGMIQKKSSDKSTNKRSVGSLGLKQSSSGSTRSKLLWRGWKTTIGRVKRIVKDIDEQRIPPPVLKAQRIPPSVLKARNE